ncbi:hypothetical protein Sa4125_11250 [Aureimonas sp. SA4125]|nr:hypothetical protein Sa4125_11250 [Aureimonas sp. SA4125]
MDAGGVRKFVRSMGLEPRSRLGCRQPCETASDRLKDLVRSSSMEARVPKYRRRFAKVGLDEVVHSVSRS